MSEADNPLERAVELLVYAPIGLAMFAKDTVPTFMKMFVARGQTEVTQRRKSAEGQASQYKTIGQMAVKYGGPEVKRQAGAAADTVRKRAEETIAGIASVAATQTGIPTGPPTTGTPTSGTGATAPDGAAAAGPGASTDSQAKAPGSKAPKATAPKRTPPKPTSAAPDRANAALPRELPIPDYDLLSASQVIDRLPGLAEDDLAAVRGYEVAHRSRTTILGKITQLTA